MNAVETPLLSTFLESAPAKRIPGYLLYAKVWGSHSHATALPTSDVDYLAVYQLPLREVVSLRPGPETVDGKGPDFQAHELGKFCALLLKGNPGVVETLFTEHMEMRTPVWELLRERRKTFLNQRTLNQYIGYCEGQLHRLDAGTKLHTHGGDYNTKWAYHLIRLAIDAVRIAEGGAPLVMKDGAELDLLMRIRNGEFEPHQIAGYWSGYKDKIKAARAHLPEEADAASLDDWLWRRRAEYPE